MNQTERARAALNFKFVAYLGAVRMSQPPIRFEAKELKVELLRRVTQAERDWVTSDQFLKSDVWSRLRYDIREADEDGCCKACGSDRKLNVDHKYNRRDFPQRALLWSNLQLLCAECNKGKGNRYNTDWEKRRARAKTAAVYTPSGAIMAEALKIAPHWNPDQLLRAYRRFCGRKSGEAVRYPDKAFIGWVTKCAKDQPRK